MKLFELIVPQLPTHYWVTCMEPTYPAGLCLKLLESSKIINWVFNQLQQTLLLLSLIYSNFVFWSSTNTTLLPLWLFQVYILNWYVHCFFFTNSWNKSKDPLILITQRSFFCSPSEKTEQWSFLPRHCPLSFWIQLSTESLFPIVQFGFILTW